MNQDGVTILSEAEAIKLVAEYVAFISGHGEPTSNDTNRAKAILELLEPYIKERCDLSFDEGVEWGDKE